MERAIRKPFQGTMNIIRFNWHFYVIATVSVLTLPVIAILFDVPAVYLVLLASIIFLSTLLSLAVSYYIYDFSGLYDLHWLDQLQVHPQSKLLNIHAGFDETSELIKVRYPSASLQVFDFYNPQTHTEVSIKRARKAYPAFPGTIPFSIPDLPVLEADHVFLMFAAHEIRDMEERVQFFQSLSKILKSKGKVIVAEHLRDLPNFFAYNIGFLHFLSIRHWEKTFKAAELDIAESFKVTPFISVFILEKHASPS